MTAEARLSRAARGSERSAPHTTIDALPEIVTVPEAAQFLRVAKSTLYAAVKAGQVPSLSLGRRVLIARATLCRILGNGRPAPVTAVYDGGQTPDETADDPWGWF